MKKSLALFTLLAWLTMTAPGYARSSHMSTSMNFVGGSMTSRESHTGRPVPRPDSGIHESVGSSGSPFGGGFFLDWGLASFFSPAPFGAPGIQYALFLLALYTGPARLF